MSDSAFKNWYNEKSLSEIGKAIKKAYPAFKDKEFNKISKKFAPLELKGRVLLITSELKRLLPEDYKSALKILVKVMEESDLSGFSYWPFSEYISQHGLNDFDESMKAMYILTQKFTSEFAVRPFILKNHVRVLKYFTKWAKDKNVSVRRWVSEGSRPMLPWGGNIPLFIMDPTLTLILLDQLRFDDELFVRKSVANHLNDITKNHPKVVVDLLKIWEKDAPAEHQEKIQWIKRHALRTLIKKGNADALKIMGVNGDAKIKISEIKLNQKKYKLNDKLEFSFEIISTAKESQKLVIDYAIDFVKSSGKKSSKVFKLKTVDLAPKQKLDLRKSHNLKPITTMTYYKGVHHLMIQVNGKILQTIEWDFNP